MPMREIAALALFEWKAIKSKRGLLLYTLFFAGFCLAISYFGSFYSGNGSLQGLKSTAVSLLNFSLLFIPLMALLSGVNCFTDQRESWDLICTQPISVKELLLGKFIGQLAGLSIPIFVGFGLSAVMIAMKGSLEGWREFLLLLFIDLLTAAIFLAISFLLVALCKRRSKSHGLAFVVWTAMLLFYDMIVIGLVILTNGVIQKISLWTALLLNPADMVRIIGVTEMGSYDAISATGTLVQQLMQNKGIYLLTAALVIWLVGCLMGAIFITRMQDLAQAE
jgi:Cu-processing system permease protein